MRLLLHRNLKLGLDVTQMAVGTLALFGLLATGHQETDENQ